MKTSEQEASKAKFLKDVDTIFSHPETFEREASGLFDKIQRLLNELHTSACTLRIRKLLNDALKQNPELDLGERIGINGCVLVDISKLNAGTAPELVDTDEEIPF